MELSKRLKAVAGLVTEGASVADIGTDHGYVPIWLIQSGRAAKVIAMDVNEGPLERARGHIRSKRLENVIFTRKSDGLQALHVGEADTMIAAGMGGGLVIRILENSPELQQYVDSLDIDWNSTFRKIGDFLSKGIGDLFNSAFSVEEDMVEEDGKYYPMMKLVHGEEAPYSQEELYYGRLLLKKKNPVLYQFLQREHSLKRGIADRLGDQTGKGAESRQKELQDELERIEHAIASYEM